MGTPDVRPKTCVPSQEAREIQFSTAPLPLTVLVRLRLRRLFVELFDELTRRAAREGPESVQAAQLRQMLVPGLGPGE